jgi:hypothetical protein
MPKFKQEDINTMFDKINKGISEYKKERAIGITKSILIGIWTVTVFPIILLYMFIFDKK